MIKKIRCIYAQIQLSELNRKLTIFARLCLLLCIFCNSTAQATTNIPQSNTQLKITVSIKPIHSIVAAISQGVTEPALMLTDIASPHSYQLKPLDYIQFEQSDIFIWVGPELETFLSKPIKSSKPRKILQISNIPDLNKLPLRTGHNWGEHHHHHGDDLHKYNTDPHFWLDINNTKIITQYISNYLQDQDPNNKLTYIKNTNLVLAKLASLDNSLKQQLQPFQNYPFLVFHDAYQYFENSYGLTAKGAILQDPHLPLNAKHLLELRKQITDNNIQCIFYEPQFNNKAIIQAFDDLPTKLAELDPLGSKLNAGPDSYFQIMTNIGNSIATCFESK